MEKNNPDQSPFIQKKEPDLRPIDGKWSQTTRDGHTVPIIYKDKTFTNDGKTDRLTITIGENNHPLRENSFYKIFLRAYTTVGKKKMRLNLFNIFPTDQN